MKNWTIKSTGKLERILIFYVGLFSFLFVFYAIASRAASGDYSFGNFLASFAIFWVPVALIALYRILKSKIPSGISISDLELKIEYSKKEKIEIPLEGLAFAVTNHHKSHIGLTIYKKFEGSRGQDVFKKVTELIGRNFTMAWKKEQLQEIHDSLKSAAVTETKADNRDLPLWERILSN